MLSRSQKYTALGSQGDTADEDALSDCSTLEGPAARSSTEKIPYEHPLKRQHHAAIVHAALIALGVSIILSSVSVFYVLQAGKNINNKFLRQSSYYSPLFDMVDIPQVDVKFNGSFLHHTDPPSIFRQDPSPEVDEAWFYFADLKWLTVDSEDRRKLGKDPSKTVKLPENYGGPDDHIVSIDAFHQVHCLNTLRMEANFDYYYGDRWPDRNAPEVHRMHVSHCIYMLLQNILCHADMDLITWRWVDVSVVPLADFSINRKCRDVEKLVEWRNENAVKGAPNPENNFFRKPVDVVPVKAPDQYKDLFHQWKYVHNDVEYIQYEGEDPKTKVDSENIS